MRGGRTESPRDRRIGVRGEARGERSRRGGSPPRRGIARGADGGWTHRAYGAGEAAELPSLSLTFSTDELYDAAGVR